MFNKIKNFLFPKKLVCLYEFEEHDFKDIEPSVTFKGTNKFVGDKEITEKISYEQRICKRCNMKQYHHPFYGWIYTLII